MATDGTDTAHASGGPSALRGFRLQGLYILHRALAAPVEAELLQPEGAEDLGVYRGARLAEVCQVKARSEPLTLSDFSPGQKDGFVQRTVARLQARPDLVVRVATYGPVGPELLQGASSHGKDRAALIRKLGSHGVTASDAHVLLDRLVFTAVGERELRISVRARISEVVTGHDPDAALDLLLFWIHEASEARRMIDAQLLIERLTRIGRYLADRATHAIEWFTTIEPVEDRILSEEERARLLAEFSVGVAAQYEHILAGAAVPRPRLLDPLRSSLARARVVVVHGASGEGKTALALMFLSELPNAWRFRVRDVADGVRARSIARALLGHSRALQMPVYVHLDVGPGDSGWAVVARELARDQEVRVIVTIREEDWRRSATDGAFVFEEVELSLTEDEARQIYAEVRERAPDAPPTFQDAWARFGGSGPLLEFVHLCSQGEGLTDRMLGQVRRLRDEVREGQLSSAELDLLRVASVAGAYETSVDLPKLVESLGLVDPGRTVERFEREYLVRKSSGGRMLTGLHPIRSGILTEALCDAALAPWGVAAVEALRVMAATEVGRFLLYAFSRRDRADRDLLISELWGVECDSWTRAAGIARALLWRGLADYVEDNRELIEEIRADHPGSWQLLVDFDVARLGEGTAERILLSLAEVAEPFARAEAQAREFRARQSDPSESYQHLRSWIDSLAAWPATPSTERDWVGLGELAFWGTHLAIDVPIVETITEPAWRSFVHAAAIESIAAAAEGLATRPEVAGWWPSTTQEMLDRFRDASDSPVADDDGESISVEFIFDPASPAEKGDRDPHAETMRRIGLVRRLVPGRRLYRCQGHGHRLVDASHDQTTKAIPAENLPSKLLTSRNGVFQNLAELWWRPPTWSAFWHDAFEQRRRAVSALERLTNLVRRHFRGRSLAIGANEINAAVESLRLIGDASRLPVQAVDEWGFVSESTARGSGSEEPAPGGIALDAYLPLWRAYRDYMSSLGTLADQATHALVLRPTLGRSEQPDATRMKAREIGIEEGRANLSLTNLQEAARALPVLQRRTAELLSGDALQAAEALAVAEARAMADALIAWRAMFAPRHRQVADVVTEGRTARARRLHRLRADLGAALRANVGEARWSVRDRRVGFGDHEAMLIIGEWRSMLVSLGRAQDAASAIAAGIRGWSDADRAALVEEAPTILVLDLIGGRPAATEAMALNTLVLAQSEDDPKWFNLVPKRVELETMRSWGVEPWNDPGMFLGDPLLGDAVSVWLYLRHLADLDISQELDELGTAIAERHVTRLSRAAETSLNDLVERSVQLAELLRNRGIDDDLPDGLLRSVSDLATTLGDGVKLSELAAVVEQAETAVGAAAVARAAWFDTALEDLVA